MNRSRQDPWESIAIEYPPELPITQRKDEIVAAIQAHQVVVLAGETGSGKTTQIPKMCLDAGLGRSRKIACTQPRRVAALSVAQRVAEELKVNFGAEVGAKIRFTDQTSRRTRIKFMTDGMLLTEIHSDPLMREYDAVIIDEAHERSLNIDFLLGHLNQLRRQRPDLKIIITSATIDTEKFSQAFDGAPIIEVSGRVYPVEVIYAPLDEFLEEAGEFTFLEGIAESVQRIQDDFPSGDVLAFLPTEKDIREAMELLQGRCGSRFEIVPCFGRLSSAEQQRIFQATAKRKLVLATNIAETSLTIPGIRFVIDTGLARISRYNPRARTKRLPIAKISQSSANQRKGRCGRVADGVCIRLYSEKDFESRPLYTVPEIQRANLADVILRMRASRLGEVETFPFIDPPSPAAITAGYALLEELGALDAQRRLTTLGRQLAKLPVDPTVGRMLLEAEREGVEPEVLVIAAGISIQDPRERPMDKEAAARQAHARFSHPHSDFLALLSIWEAVHDEIETLSQGRLRKFCKSHFLNYLRIREWRDIHDQLLRAMPAPDGKRPRLELKSEPRPRDSAAYQAIHTCLLTGLLANAGRREAPNVYLCSANRKAFVFPGSALFLRQSFEKKSGPRQTPAAADAGPKPKGPEWIMAGEIVETSKLYARTVAAIDPEWLIRIGEHIIRRSYSDPIFLPTEGRVIARESIRIHGLEIQNRKVSYGKVDPAKATEIFIREALLNEEYEAPANWTFLERNRKLMRRIQNAQTVVSVAHWMGVEEAAFRFYQSQLENVSSIHDLNRRLRQKPDATDGLLMSEADLTASEDAVVDLSLFPESVQLDNAALPIEYHYNPGHQLDGVTIRLPYNKVKSVDSALLDWLIPGHLEPKIHALLKALPKDIRQRLLPLAETAKTIAQTVRPTGVTLIESLKQHLEAAYSIETYSSDWDASAIPDHLKARLEVIDKQGSALAAGRDLPAVQAALEAKQAEINRQSQGDIEELWRRARERYERPIEAVADLEAGDGAPDRIQIGNLHGVPLYAYPALRAFTLPPPSSPNRAASSPPPSAAPPPAVRYALFRSRADASAANAGGIAALIEHELRRDLAWIQSDLKAVEKLGPTAVAFRSMNELKEDVYQSIRQTLRTHTLDTTDSKAIGQAVADARALSKGLLYKMVDLLRAVFEKRQSLVVQPHLRREFGAEIDQLLPSDFIRRTPYEILPRIPIFLEAIARRPAKRAKDPQRFAQLVAELQRYRTRFAQMPEARGNNADPRSVRWMIEEFAVSLFAQELGTAYPVSPKKLDQAFADHARHDTAGPQASAPASGSPRQKDAQPDPIRRPSTARSDASRPSEASPDRPTKADLESLKKLFG